MRLVHPSDLANVADYLTRVDFSRDVLREIATDLAIWSQANTRAYNEMHGTQTFPLNTTDIIRAYDNPTFRYDRASALRSIAELDRNVRTPAGKGPNDFESFDVKCYSDALARIVVRAFKRLFTEDGTDG